MIHKRTMFLSQLRILCLLVLTLDISSAFHSSYQHQPQKHLLSATRQSNTFTTSNKIFKLIHQLAQTSHNSETSSNLPTLETTQIHLSQVSAEIMTCRPTKDTNSNPFSNLTRPKQPLLFIHGSFHASWCWAEHFMPYFASFGYPCYAISLRGTGGTFAGEGVKKVRIEQHVQDITDFINYVQESESQLNANVDSDPKPVLIAHSFGGLAIMKYLESHLLPSQDSDDVSSVNLPISGVVSMCSVPPSGNGKMTMRFLKRSLKDSWKITAGLAMKKCINDEKLCRELFFDEGCDEDVEGISSDDLKRIQGYFERDTVATIDLMDLAKQLPSIYTDENGKATFLENDIVSPNFVPALVIGARDDFIVDEEGVVEVAKYYGVEEFMVESSHDVMLDKRWKNAANKILSFLDGEIN